MVTQAVSSYGTILQRGINTIAEISSIKGPKLSLSTRDVTHLASPNNFREFIGGLRDGGEVAIEGNFYPGDTNGQIGLRDDVLLATVQDFTITFPTATGTVWTFKGLVTSFETNPNTPDDQLSFAATIKITAKPNLGVTASVDITDLIVVQETGGAVVTGVPTPFVGTTYVYSYVVNNATNWITLQVDDDTAVSIIAHNSFNDHETDLIDDVASGHLPLGLADTITTFRVTVKDANKAPKAYTLYIIRP